MAKGTAKYWLGKGVALIAGTKYSTGEEIPANKVDKKTFAVWEKEGLVGDAPIPIAQTASETKDKATIKSLTKELSKVRGELKDSVAANKKGGKCTECPKKDEEIATLKADIEEKAALIEKQAKQLDATSSGGGFGDS
jgi:hypothetical protein